MLFGNLGYKDNPKQNNRHLENKRWWWWGGGGWGVLEEVDGAFWL